MRSNLQSPHQLDVNRSDFPLLSHHPELVYLDSAATTQKPQVVIDAVEAFYGQDNANPGRGLYDLGYHATELHAQCRQAVAQFFSVDSEQIIFTSGCTESLNLTALNFRDQLQPGDEIAVSIYEHHSNFVPWQKLAERTGAKFKVISDFSEKTLKSTITPKTKVVAITMVSNVTGERLPVEKIVKTAHEVGAKVVLDVAQAVAHLSLDVKKLDVDFLAFSGHKMYAPMGVGVLYIKNPADFQPVFFGGGAIAHVSEQETTLTPDISRFEPGTRNLAAEVGLKSAIDWLSSKRQNAKSSELVQDLVQLAHDQLSKIAFIESISPRDAIGIVAFNLKGIHPHDVATLLNDEGICIRAGYHCAEPLMRHLGLDGGCCRASFGLYNSEQDVERLISALREAWEILK